MKGELTLSSLLNLVVYPFTNQHLFVFISGLLIVPGIFTLIFRLMHKS